MNTAPMPAGTFPRTGAAPTGPKLGAPLAPASATPVARRNGVLGALAMVKDAAIAWNDDHAMQLGASLAYYAIFAIGPLLLIAISVAGLVFGRDAAENQIVETLRSYIGTSGAESIQQIILKSNQRGSGILGTIIGAALLLFGAAGLFAQLQDALDLIWHAKKRTEAGWKTFLRQRFFSLAMVLGTGFLLLVSLLLSAALTATGKFFTNALPGGATLWQVVNSALSFCVVTVLFALIFKLLPEVEMRWTDVWPGAVLTAALFILGKFLLGLYIEKGSVATPYGAAGSLIGVLVWIYYASQILFFGAELTKAYTQRYGSQKDQPQPAA